MRASLYQRVILCSALAVLLFSANALAHDYWLEPEAFFIAVGGSVTVRMHLGGNFVSEEERPYKESSNVMFELYTARGAQDLAPLAQDGETPVAQLKLNEAGNYLLAMERKPQTITLPAEKFTEYLKEEGLDSIIAERARLNESGSEGRERYRRFLKSLLQVGDRQDVIYKRVVGQELEIFPLNNPYDLKPGSTLRLAVFFQGQRLGGATVFAHHRAGGKVYTQKLKTDSNGMVYVKLERAGEWLIRLVHMRRCVDCKAIDWESFWSAFSFGVR